MKILIVSRGYPTNTRKMNGIFEFDLAKALTKAGHNVIFAAVDMSSFRKKRKFGFESFKKDGVQVESVNFYSVGRVSRRILNYSRKIALKLLYKKIFNKYGNPDIIHAHFLDFGYITVKLFSQLDIPIVLTEHLSAMNDKNLNKYLIKMGRKTYPQVNKVITVSNSLSDNISKVFDVNSTVIPNIIDTSSFQYKEQSSDNSDFTFISTGGLIKRKGMDILIDAFYQVFKGNPNVKLYIYGEGPERSKLENMINKYNLSKQIHLMGLVDRQEIGKKMNESKCFVLASKLETFGVAYIEALAMGLPVIATKCGGPENFVTNENGILIPVNDTNQLAKALEKMYSNISLYNNDQIAKTTIQKFSPEIIANQVIGVYRDAINKIDKDSEI